MYIRDDIGSLYIWIYQKYFGEQSKFQTNYDGVFVNLAFDVIFDTKSKNPIYHIYITKQAYKSYMFLEHNQYIDMYLDYIQIGSDQIKNHQFNTRRSNIQKKLPDNNCANGIRVTE